MARLIDLEELGGNRIATMENPYGDGLKLEGPADVDGILAATRTDWRVEKEPVQTVSGIALPNTYAVARVNEDGTRVPFANGRCVGRNWTAFQNRDLAELGLACADAYGDEMVFEAGGYLREGEVVWYLAKTPEAAVVRETELGLDKVEPYLFLLHAHNGTMSVTAQFASHRPFCNNQIASIFRQGVKSRIRLAHTKGIHERAAEAKRTLRAMFGFFDAHVEEMKALDAVDMKLDEMRRFAEELIGETQDAIAEADRTITERVRANRTELIDRACHLFQSGRGNVGRSRFDALQAVGELVDHHLVGRTEDSRFRRMVLGGDNDLKARAHRLLAR